MKKIFLVLAVVVFVTVPALAARAEFVGGYIHSWIDPTEVNDLIGDFNEYYVSEDEEELAEITGANGFYLGLTTKIWGLDSAVKYEYLNLGTNRSWSYEGTYVTSDDSMDVNLDVYGVCYEMVHQLTGNIDLYGGIGYYWGAGSVDLVENWNYLGGLDAATVQVEDSSSYETHYDLTLDGTLGYKVGAEYSHDLGKGFSFNAGVGYRYLVMEVGNELTEDSDGTISECSEEIPEDLTADLSGFEVSLGFNVAF